MRRGLFSLFLYQLVRILAPTREAPQFGLLDSGHGTWPVPILRGDVETANHDEVVVFSRAVLADPFHELRIRWRHRRQPSGAGRDGGTVMTQVVTAPAIR